MMPSHRFERRITAKTILRTYIPEVNHIGKFECTIWYKGDLNKLFAVPLVTSEFQECSSVE